MADNAVNTTSILKNDPAFEGLDFAGMRAEGINHIAELSGKIWTDHNFHDPGITILELLCYALIDLGYRTRLPPEDIFSRDPSDTSPDDNFFTPAQLLTCNPVTIMDFRKLLMDIKEVKNAWLEVNDKWIECGDNDEQDFSNFLAANTGNRPGCKTFLNGLYKVYIELYKGPYTPEPQWTTRERAYIEEAVEKVRKTLMVHRNLCEDFVSITVLCKEKIGVCADIELDASANAEKVYLKIVETLKTFFSPDPRFYTLPQLLDKGKPIEDIFAGRPYLPESHGFVDTCELEKISLRKEIHVSDVYNALFGIEGISTIRKLRLRKCGSGNGNTSPGECDWKYYVQKDHTTEFSLDCSGFRFSRNGVTLSVNEKKHKAFFDLNYSLAGKILHQEQFDALDLPVPNGIYRPELADHYSIQNELPRVYGVSEGGIPDSASPLRQAQALQLKGFLLFFDQLLANYLSQLSQLRKLFSFKKSKDGHTYFTGTPQQVPDIDKLLRFGSGDNAGSINVVPVEKAEIDGLVAEDKLKDADILSDFKKIEFVTAADRDTAVYSMIEDLKNRNFKLHTIRNSDGSWFFYITPACGELSLLSNKYYPAEGDAKRAAENVTYFGAFEENYHSYTLNNTSASYFSLGLNMAGFSVYLQRIVEDEALYLQRRNAFLDHLMARFAESFTDYALLSFHFLEEEELRKRDLIKKNKFLENYDTLGRDRGRAYDYFTDGWNTKNISGFEKRVKAFAGVEGCCPDRSVCHFEVMEYSGQYYWTIAPAGKSIFKSNVLFDSPEDAVADLEAFLSALKEEDAYRPVENTLHEAHTLSIQYKGAKIAYPMLLPTEEKAMMLGEQLRQIITETPGHDDIFISKELYKPQLFNESGEPVRKTAQSFETTGEATAAARDLLNKINEQDWELVSGDETQRPQLNLKAGSDPFRLIDITAFSREVKPAPDEYRWTLKNEAGEAMLTSRATYPSEQDAVEALVNELTTMEMGEGSFKLYEGEGLRFDLVQNGDAAIASSSGFGDENARTEAIKFVIEFFNNEKADKQYTLLLNDACHWQVQFGAGYVFRSTALLADPENAMNAWRKDKRTFRVLENFVWDWDEKGAQRLLIKDQGRIIARFLPHPGRSGLPEDIFNIVQASLNDKTFKAEPLKAKTGYGFRLYEKGQVLLSGYEVYETRGAAFYQMLGALQIAADEGMYLKSGDEGNRQFTFLLRNQESRFVAEHPVRYDTEKEREDELQKTIGILKAKQPAATAGKEPVRYTFSITRDEKLLLSSLQKFATTEKAEEEANLVLIGAGDPENYLYRKDASGEYRVLLQVDDQPLAMAPGTFADEFIAEGIRNSIIEAVSPHLYTMRVTAFPDKWRFRFHPGIEPWRVHFESAEEYNAEEMALQAYKKMAADLGNLKLQKTEDNTQLVSRLKVNNAKVTANLLPAENESGAAEEPDPATALTVTQLLHQLSATEDKKLLQRMVKRDEMAEQGTWVYRVRKKEEYFAYHLNCTNEEDTERLIKNIFDAVTHKPDYLLICQGGDIIHKRKDPVSGGYLYHYVIRARNVFYPGTSPQKELVLFVSYKGYPSQEEAEKAFEENYLLVLKRASKTFHYGAGKFISLEESYAKTGDACPSGDSPVVCVPKETLETYYGNDTAAAIDGLSELAKSYPIRLSGNNRYKFSLYDYKKKISWFISAEYYESPLEAMKGFLFLLVLVRNKKNYYTYCDPDTGNTFIVLREILLESSNRFMTEADAWGKQGLEKLIAVSQTEGAFHIYWNSEDCCFTFFVACKSKIIHPCTYDTSETRDKALWKIYKELSNYQVPALPSVNQPGGQNYFEVEYEGNLVAQLPLRYDDNTTGYCRNEFFDLLEWVLQLGKCPSVKADGKFELENDDGITIAWLDNAAINEEEWIKKLVEMATRFPVFRKDGRFYFRIPYPGAPEDSNLTDPCGCDEQLPPDSRDCYIAWIGGCYETCQEAFAALEKLPDKLKLEENYRAVFDCNCGSYRIELIEASAIVAQNPQCYTNREMVCEAVERTKRMMNCEGLHLVEHILLRPRPRFDHCRCLIPDCPDYHCRFKWEEGEEDPCKPAGDDPCFTPGQDPYSCIATVVLPAWPERFTKQASRDLVSRILYREAPSHIMLRILWLAPKDFCRFETKYKAWLRWLSNKKDYCNGPFDQCAFIDFLFNTRLDCWWPEEYCMPCDDETVVTNPCAELNNQEDRANDCATSVNDIYCWTTPDCCYEHPYLRLRPEQEAEKAKFIRRRTANYMEQVQGIAERWQGDENIGHAISYLQKNEPEGKTLLSLIDGLKTVQGDENNERAEAYRELSMLLLAFYLDRSLLDKYDPTMLSDINRTIQKVNMSASDVRNVLKQWYDPELEHYLHEKTLQAVRGIFKNK